MRGPEPDIRPGPSPWQDLAWRTAFRVGFPLALAWWRLRGGTHRGAVVAVHVGPALLMLRSSYRAAWNFPGGGIKPRETPEAAARRELAEETGIEAPALLPAGTASGLWDWRQDQVTFFELHLDRLPALRLDNREITAARLVRPEDLPGLPLTGPVAAYLDQTAQPHWNARKG